MHPHLFTFPWGTPANAYGTLILMGGLSTVALVVWDAKSRGIAGGRVASFVVDFYLYVVVGAFVGGRVLHVLTVPGVYAQDPGKLISIDDTGFVFFGSLLAIALGWAWLARRHRVDVGVVCDIGLTWMGLAHAFGRLGCTMAGCCWGGVHTGGGGVRFGPESVVVLSGGAKLVGRGEAASTLPLHPTQLYEACGLLAIVIVLGWLRVRNGPQRPWRMVSRYAIGYGLLRAGIEVFRGDLSRGFLFEYTSPTLARLLALPSEHPLALSISQAIALSLVAAGTWGLWRTRNPARAEPVRYAPAPP